MDKFDFIPTCNCWEKNVKTRGWISKRKFEMDGRRVVWAPDTLECYFCGAESKENDTTSMEDTQEIILQIINAFEKYQGHKKGLPNIEDPIAKGFNNWPIKYLYGDLREIIDDIKRCPKCEEVRVAMAYAEGEIKGSGGLIGKGSARKTFFDKCETIFKEL